MGRMGGMGNMGRMIHSGVWRRKAVRCVDYQTLAKVRAVRSAVRWRKVETEPQVPVLTTLANDSDPEIANAAKKVLSFINRPLKRATNGVMP
jgi:hypothetical protein